MNGLALLLALVVGQPLDGGEEIELHEVRSGGKAHPVGAKCDVCRKEIARHIPSVIPTTAQSQWGSAAGGQFGREGVEVIYDQERSPEFDSGWRKYCVRVNVGSHGGSGTIIGVHDGKGLVITARHVVENPGAVSILRNGQKYTARTLVAARTGDLGAIEFDDPPSDIQQIGIATRPARFGTMFGFGPSYPGTFHAHQGRYLGNRGTPQTYNEARLPDDEYAFSSENGDSGGGVFDEQGHLCGVLWGGKGGMSNVVSTSKLRQFLGAPATEERIFTLTPFFIKCRRISRAPTTASRPTSPTTSLPPEPGTTVKAPGVSVAVGPTGQNGKDGKDGKDAAPVDIAGIVKEIMTQIKADPSLVGKPGKDGTNGKDGANGKDGKDANSTPLPFAFRIKRPDGTLTPAVSLLNTDLSKGPIGYSLEIDASQLAPTTVPVTPLPK